MTIEETMQAIQKIISEGKKMTYTVECVKYGNTYEKFVYNNKETAMEVFNVLVAVSHGNEIIRYTEVETGEGISQHIA